jgi:hypothetical protein
VVVVVSTPIHELAVAVVLAATAHLPEHLVGEHLPNLF